MTDIKDFVKTDRDRAALEEMKERPVDYARAFKNIFFKLCPACKRLVMKNFRRNQNTEFKDYCESCQRMALEEYEKCNK